MAAITTLNFAYIKGGERFKSVTSASFIIINLKGEQKPG